MTSLTTASLFIIAQLLGWIFVVLPGFESVHFRFFQRGNSNCPSIVRILFGWYGLFFAQLKMRAAKDPRRSKSIVRKNLLFAIFALVLLALSILPLSSMLHWNGQSFYLDGGSQSFSPYFFLALLFCIEMVYFLMGFTFERHFVGLTSIQTTSGRQLSLLVLTLALIATPNVDIDVSMRMLVDAQTQNTLLFFPAWGAILNPIAFICACFAVWSYIDQWRDDEYPPVSTIRKSMQSELVGMELAVFRMTRSLEYLLLYAFIVTVFLGGPFLDDVSIHPIQALLQMSVKIFIVAVCVLVVQAIVPRKRLKQQMKFVFLVLLPLELVSYPISLLVRAFLNSH